jgi:hypothetical protein
LAAAARRTAQVRHLLLIQIVLLAVALRNLVVEMVALVAERFMVMQSDQGIRHPHHQAKVIVAALVLKLLLVVVAQ